MNAQQDYWQKQTSSLFPDLEWAKPEHKSHAGRLVVMGGNAYDFADVALSYTMLQAAGIGDVKILLPKSVQKLLPPDATEMNFVANTQAGSFAKDALSDIKVALSWSEGLFLPGQLGRNSETALLLQEILSFYRLPTVITKDAINYLYTDTRSALDNDQLVAVLSLSQLQKMLKTALWPSAVQFKMNTSQLVELLHDLTTKKQLSIVTAHNQQLIVASGGKVSTTAISVFEDDMWQLEVASNAAVQLLHYKQVDFYKVLTHAVFESTKD